MHTPSEVRNIHNKFICQDVWWSFWSRIDYCGRGSQCNVKDRAYLVYLIIDVTDTQHMCSRNRVTHESYLWLNHFIILSMIKPLHYSRTVHEILTCFFCPLFRCWLHRLENGQIIKPIIRTDFQQAFVRTTLVKSV